MTRKSQRTITRETNARIRRKKVYDHYRKLCKKIDNGKQVYSHEYMVDKCSREFGYSEGTIEKIIQEFN